MNARFLGSRDREAALGAQAVELHLDIDSFQIHIGAPVGIVPARRADNGLAIDADGNASIQCPIVNSRLLVLQNSFFRRKKR